MHTTNIKDNSTNTEYSTAH